MNQSATNPRSASSTAPEATTSKQETAGAFDIRNMIALLLGLFGLILLFSWIAIDPGLNPDTGDPKNATYNLITGICLVIASILFAVWAKLRPIRVAAEAARIREKPHQEMEAQRERALAQLNDQVGRAENGKDTHNRD